jgi:regulator of cell morphogenesis and NO signaling
MRITENSIIGEIVANNYKTSSIFSAVKIDFCCKGNRTIKDAATALNIDTSILVSQLNSILDAAEDEVKDVNTITLTELIDHIVKIHHAYITKSSLEIVPLLEKITSVHGKLHPELKEIEKEFKSAVGELAMHMKKEELILFPYIKNLEKAINEKTSVHKSVFDSVLSPITAMKKDHTVEGERLEKISQLTNDYITPSDGCATYQITMKLLKEFEQDLHRHIHLENNILFEKALQLESEFRSIFPEVRN